MDIMGVLRGISEHKDRYLLVHQAGVCHFADLLVCTVAPGLRPVVLLAATWHDVGKALIPDDILFKPAPLSPEEWRLVRQHPVSGADLVARADRSGLWAADQWQEVVLAVRHHHERWDGRGYPDGLETEEIPYAARIIAVADAYVAMTADRPYGPAMIPEEALREIAAGRGTQFDPYLANAFITLMEREIVAQDRSVLRAREQRYPPLSGRSRQEMR